MSKRRRTHLTLDSALVSEARTLGINISRAGEAGIAEAVRKKKERRWLEENAETIEGSNRYVEEHGLPLEHKRLW